MPLPLFFIEENSPDAGFLTLNEETSKHIVQSLRMKIGEPLMLTNGKGYLITAEISDDHKKRCMVKVNQSTFVEKSPVRLSIAISLLKNPNRFELFLEKATELGITEIIPMISARTEKLHFRLDRMKNILISAILQSGQAWLPSITEPVQVSKIIAEANHSQKFIAHCMDDAKVALKEAVNPSMPSQIILIGPEGDFTKEEINIAFQNHFIPVALGQTRLRTETAGIAAAVIMSVR